MSLSLFSRVFLLIGLLSTISFSHKLYAASFELPIESVATLIGRGIYVTGTVTSGSVNDGDSAQVITKSGAVLDVTIIGLERPRELLTYAEKGDSIGVILKGASVEVVSRGDTLVIAQSGQRKTQ
ncbi:EF-Tu/IF-2/RF-3 family GTPase [Pseudoalteromonas rubra]|uniref:Translation elongation factor EFTu-like domain-containing protein n=1 Tax=Pseudoalteromonas rubra TaxID=43658 RepID=A0A0U3I513_9GAMM|nr:EF-Tu/IF-2/RF-3 family GTPase [Pseudoalteromonas rubra]ALU42151.1 hypothetical protein AT705_03885 [Pseudoalteromonas rubra]